MKSASCGRSVQGNGAATCRRLRYSPTFLSFFSLLRSFKGRSVWRLSERNGGLPAAAAAAVAGQSRQFAVPALSARARTNCFPLRLGCS